MMDPSDSDRSQILADFQACSNIDDIGHALAVLDATNWNLTEAVNMALGTDESPGGSNDLPAMRVNGRGLDVTGRFPMVPAPPAIDLSNDSGPITVRRATPPLRSNYSDDSNREQVDHLGIYRRRITFHVQYGDDLFELNLLDSEDVEELRERIAVHVGVDRSQFDIQWENKKMHPGDNLTLMELKLPATNTLRVVPLSNTASGPSTSGANSHSMDTSTSLQIKLDVSVGPGHHDTTIWTEPGNKTVLEVKKRVHTQYGLPVNEQEWTGWPAYVTDDTTLAACHLDTPTHHLTVSRQISSFSQPSASTSSTAGSRNAPVAISDSDSEHDYDMMDDENDIDLEAVSTVPSQRLSNLIPAYIEDLNEAINYFKREFARRYGNNQPLFYTGTFKDAVDSALQCPASERRLLAVYLHHDDSVAAHVFCTQVLCTETVSTYLNANFVTWGWDVTLSINKERFISMFENVVGSSSADVVRGLDVDDLPVLVILSKVRGSLEVLCMSRATVTAEEMMVSLLQAEEVFQQTRLQDIKEEEERKNREEMKRLQDAAYEESLARDRVKQQQQEEVERKQREEEEARRLEEQTMEAIKQSVAETIPDEPPSDCADVMARLRFRCPDGKLLNRRFLGSTNLATLLNYLVTEGFRTEEFKVLTTFPRRDLSVEDTAKTLEDLKLCPQETLILAAK